MSRLQKFFVDPAGGKSDLLGLLIWSDKVTIPYILSPFVQGDTPKLEIGILDRNPGNFTSPYSRRDNINLNLRVSIGPTPQGNVVNNPHAIQSTWTKNSDAKTFSGDLALNTQAIADLLGAAASAKAFFEVELSEGGLYQTVYQREVVILAEVTEGTPTVPTPIEDFLKVTDARATYVPFELPAGQGIRFKSLDSTKRGILYLGDDGEFHMDPLT